MRRALVALTIAVLAGTAGAQPGAGAPPPPADPAPYPEPPPNYPDPLPPPPPVPQVPPDVYNQPVAIQLTADEAALLDKGEISSMAHLGGGVASIFFGFGLGQAIQGRWSERGWLFTVGESASVVAMVVGITQSIANDGDPWLFIGGYIALLGFRIWGAVDAFVEPPKHNQRVRLLRMKLGLAPAPYFGVLPYVHKGRDGGATAGLVFRF